MFFIKHLSKSVLVFFSLLFILTFISIIPAQNSVTGQKLFLFFDSSDNLLIKYFVLLKKVFSFNFGVTPNGNNIFKNTVNSFFRSAELLAISGIISVLFAVFLSVYSAKYQNSVFIKFLNVIVFGFCNIPYFLTAIVFIYVFSILFEQWFGISLPTTGMRSLQDTGFNLLSHIRHLVLPVTIISIIMFSQIYSFLRIQSEKIYKKQFIKFSYAIGLPEKVILFKYLLKNLLSDILRNIVNLFQI